MFDPYLFLWVQWTVTIKFYRQKTIKTTPNNNKQKTQGQPNNQKYLFALCKHSKSELRWRGK